MCLNISVSPTLLAAFEIWRHCHLHHDTTYGCATSAKRALLRKLEACSTKPQNNARDTGKTRGGPTHLYEGWHVLTRQLKRPSREMLQPRPSRRLNGSCTITSRTKVRHGRCSAAHAFPSASPADIVPSSPVPRPIGTNPSRNVELIKLRMSGEAKCGCL